MYRGFKEHSPEDAQPSHSTISSASSWAATTPMVVTAKSDDVIIAVRIVVADGRSVVRRRREDFMFSMVDSRVRGRVIGEVGRDY